MTISDRGGDRRAFLQSTLALAALATLPGSAVAATLTARSRRSSALREDTVVLYSSLDDVFIREVVKLAKSSISLDIRLVGDTEATKTTGLVQRLIAEREAPKADVWWSSEALGTVRLTNEGILEPFAPQAIQSVDAPWPKEFIKPTWTGLACRARVLVYNTVRVEAAKAPRRLADLAKPEWRSRIGLARPAFGTTRGHFAALLTDWGEDAYKAWLAALKANKVQLFDGNATVVRACASGQIDVGLTDTDDVWAGKSNGWAVEMVFEAMDPTSITDPALAPAAAPDTDPAAKLLPPPSRGALLMPTTLALVKGAPHPDNAKRLIEFLLSEPVEKLLAESEAHFTPVRPALDTSFPLNAIANPWRVDWNAVADSADRAIELATEILG